MHNTFENPSAEYVFPARHEGELPVDTGTFGERGYAVLRSLIPQDICKLLLDHVLKISRLPQYQSGDEQVARTPAIYGDPQMEHLLESLTQNIERVTSIPVYPTYSYVRVYKKGDCLKKHKDRPACEITLSLNLGYDPDHSWAIWLESGFGPVEVHLKKSDALLYRGTDVLHWRDEFVGNYAAQVFLHYVDRNGPHKDWRFDKRPALGFKADS
jgi:hypothetical protein